MSESGQAIQEVKPKQPIGTKRRHWLAGLLIFCLVMPIVVNRRVAQDAILAAPWAYPLLGRPALTGTWVGNFELPGGLQFALLLSLRRQPLATGRTRLEASPGVVISGKASWCDSSGRQATDLPVGGAVPLLSGYNASADRIEIDVGNPIHPQPGLLPYVFTGQWRSNALELQPVFSYWTGTDFVYSSSEPDLAMPIHIRLQKGSAVAFWTACASIGSSQRGAYVSNQGHN